MWTRFHIPFEDFRSVKSICIDNITCSRFTYQGDDRGEKPFDGSVLETINIVNTRAGGTS